VIGFMEAHVNEFGVEPMCRVLQIAPSTWHEHARRKADPDRLPERAKRDAELSVHSGGFSRRTSASMGYARFGGS